MIIEKVNKAPTTYEIIDLANMFLFFFFPHFRVDFHPPRPIGYYLNYDSGIFQLFYFSITI